MNESTVPNPLHPAQTPSATGLLDVGDGHRLYYEQCGPANGLPIVFLHGGPGSGCSPRHRQLFDLTRYRVVLFDQRGCGRSQPRGGVLSNTSEHLVADIERLRQHMGVERWLVVGGSWGAGLALAYASAHPAACLGLVLRGVFLGRASDLDWFFQKVGQLLPDAWDAFAKQAPAAERANLLPWLHHSLHHGTPAQALAAACAWQAWETAVTLLRMPPPSPAMPAGDAAQALLDKYRVQSHYLVNACFWDDGGLLERARALAQLPTAIVHGRLDWVCRPQAAWDLQQHLPGSHLHWLEACGHSPFEPAMAQAITDALAYYASHGHFAAWPDDVSKAGTV